MPPTRSSLSRRRRSSLGLGLTQVKPGNYGISLNPAISPRGLSFAPNVTPSTYVEVDDDLTGNDGPPSPSNALFPPTEPHQAPTRRRLPPGKRLSQGYIPRPPNAFMLFRANFVRQKHVPGSIETNHGSLSKIIGNCWRALPLEEKRYWEVEAKKAKAAHRERYPNYRFRPVHNKNKNKDKNGAPVVDKRKEKLPAQPAEEERCEVVAQLLLDGKKGEELAAAVRQMDIARQLSRPESVDSEHFIQQPMPMHPQPVYLQRRPSSVPPISLPTLPFLVAPHPQVAYGVDMFNQGYHSHQPSRAASPVSNISRSRVMVGMRRASSCQPMPSERMWEGFDPHLYHPVYGYTPMPESWELQPDASPLPEVTDTSIFQPGWTNSFKDDAPPAELSHFDQAFIPPDGHIPLHLNIGPLDNYEFVSPPSTATDVYSAVTPFEHPQAPWPMAESGPSSAFSGSPARSDASLPAPQALQPQLSQIQYAWATGEQDADKMHAQHQHQHIDMMPIGEHSQLTVPLEFDMETGYAVQYDVYANAGMDMGAEMNINYGF